MRNYVIYSDFSDTIAKPAKGDKFPPFELELGKIVENGIVGEESKTNFLEEYEDGYKKFSQIRRQKSIPYDDRALAWLNPFKDRLTLKHIDQLVETFMLNENFINITKLLGTKLVAKPLEVIIVSGTLTQIIESFLNKTAVASLLKDIKVEVKATKIVIESGVFSGKLHETDEIVYKGNFPDSCLIIGDDAMEKYGLGRRVLNIQTYNKHEVERRIDNYILNIK